MPLFFGHRGAALSNPALLESILLRCPPVSLPFRSCATSDNGGTASIPSSPCPHVPEGHVKVHLARGESFLVAERRRAGDFVPWQGRLPAAVEDLPTAYFSSLPAHPPTPSRFQPLRGPGIGRAHLSRHALHTVLPRTAIWSDLPHRWTSFCCQSAMSLSFSHIERSTLQYSVHKVAPRQ